MLYYRQTIFLLVFLAHISFGWSNTCFEGEVKLWDECYSIQSTTFLNIQSQLSGEISEEICELINLTYIDLSNNTLVGEIPDCINNLSNLDRLNLSNNQLSGEIPESIGSMENLEKIFTFIRNKEAVVLWGSTTPVEEISVFRNRGWQQRLTKDVELYNIVAKRICHERNIQINDIYAKILPEHKHLLLKDGVHFSEEGYKVLGKIVSESIVQVFEDLFK